MSRHEYQAFIVSVATCDCCGSQVTEICGECTCEVTLCEYCHGHREFDSDTETPCGGAA
jgi:hypothetical protein